MVRLPLVMTALAKIRCLKMLIWLLASYPVLRLLYFAFTDQLGANPVEFVERSTGTWAMVFLLLGLLVSPLSKVYTLAWLIGVRRLLGLWMFAFACLHLLSYLALDYAFDWADVWLDIRKHPWVLVGVAAFVLSLPLAVTSNQRAIRTLKKRWKKLHQLVYLIAVLAVLHVWWLVKKDLTEPIIYSALFAVLMGWRGLALLWRREARP